MLSTPFAKWRRPSELVPALARAIRPKQKPVDKEVILPVLQGTDQRRSYLSAVVIAKNEASYLVEWLEFHRLVGIEHVYLYDNGSTDETREILRSYIRGGFVTYLPWANFDRNAVPQRQAYAHALCNFGQRWRWMAFIDVDEFLFPLKDDSLRTVLRAYDDLPAIAVHWHMFGSSGHKRRPSGLVIENYTDRAPIPSAAGHDEILLKWKSIVDPSKVRAVVSPHVFMFEDGRKGAYDEDRRWILKTQRAGAASTVLRLNHYFTKSEEELAVKIAKGSVGRLSVQGTNPKSFAALRAAAVEVETVKDESILRFVGPLRSRMAAAQPN
jgi:hypothetical protein